MNKSRVVVVLCLIICGSTLLLAQARPRLIKEKVDLPLNNKREIELSAVFDETVFSKSKLKTLFVQQANKIFDSTKFYLIDTSGSEVEYFIITNTRKIENSEASPEGLIASSFYLKIINDEYEVVLSDFLWVDNDKKKHSISKLYELYKYERNTKQIAKLYMILKSTEQSLVETFDRAILIIDDIINYKAQEIKRK